MSAPRLYPTSIANVPVRKDVRRAVLRMCEREGLNINDVIREALDVLLYGEDRNTHRGLPGGAGIGHPPTRRRKGAAALSKRRGL